MTVFLYEVHHGESYQWWIQDIALPPFLWHILHPPLRVIADSNCKSKRRIFIGGTICAVSLLRGKNYSVVAIFFSDSCPIFLFQSVHVGYCRRGCRLFTIIDFVNDDENLNNTRDSCSYCKFFFPKMVKETCVCSSLSFNRQIKVSRS